MIDFYKNKLFDLRIGLLYKGLKLFEIFLKKILKLLFFI